LDLFSRGYRSPYAVSVLYRTDVAGHAMDAVTPCTGATCGTENLMNRYLLTTGCSLLLSWSAASADADISGLGAGIDVGTLGAGLTAVKSIIPHRLTAEIDLNAPLRVSYTTDVSGTHYSGKLRMAASGALLNLFPSTLHLFHVSAGAYFNDNRVNLGAQFAPGTFTLNGER
jgi:hypothetical protein